MGIRNKIKELAIKLGIIKVANLVSLILATISFIIFGVMAVPAFIFIISPFISITSLSLLKKDNKLLDFDGKDIAKDCEGGNSIYWGFAQLPMLALIIFDKKMDDIYLFLGLVAIHALFFMINTPMCTVCPYGASNNTAGSSYKSPQIDSYGPSHPSYQLQQLHRHNRY